MIQQRNASPRTVAAYRDTFRLLFAYAQRQLGKAPAALCLDDFDANLILGFLEHLESERHNCVRSRNCRLAAVHAFASYVALQCPPALSLAQQILAIPPKRFEKPEANDESYPSMAQARVAAPRPTSITRASRPADDSIEHR